MKIEWNKVTWYSWTLSGIIFLGVIPFLTFYFTEQYKEIIVMRNQTFLIDIVLDFEQQKLTRVIESSFKNALIIKAEGLNRDDFLKINSFISTDNVSFIKGINDFSYSWINYIKDGDMIYFTLSNQEKETKVDTGVYGLNIKTNELKTFYRISKDYYLHLIGKQNSELLLEKIDWQNSPGPCFDMWAYSFENPNDENHSIKSLDINSSSTSLSSFSVSKEIYKSAKLKQSTCIIE